MRSPRFALAALAGFLLIARADALFSAPEKSVAMGNPVDMQHPETTKALADALAGKGSPHPQEGSYRRRLVLRLGRHPRFREWITSALNARNGYLDRQVNQYLLKEEWKQADIPNFGSVTASLLRGGQPNAKGFSKLAALGVKTVVNFRMEDNAEATLVRSLGMEPIWIPLPDTCPPTREQLDRFLAVVGRSDRKAYVHCSAGVFRTGTMVAAYRISQGWSLDQALEEAKKRRFDPEWLNAHEQLNFLSTFAHEAQRRSSPAHR